MNSPRIVRFALAGAFATAVHAFGMYVYSHLGLGPHLAFFLGFAGAVIVRYFIDRSLVFQTRDGGLGQFGRYVLACAVTYTVSATLFATLLDALALPTPFAFAASVIITTLAGYTLTSLALKDRQRPSQ